MIFEIINYDELIASGDIIIEKGESKSTTPREFTIEWYATNFPFGAFLPVIISPDESNDVEDAPSVRRTGVRWENDAWAYYNPAYNPKRWSKRTFIGIVAGDAIAEYGKWIIEY